MRESTSKQPNSMPFRVLGMIAIFSVFLVGCIALAGLSYTKQWDRALGA